MMDYVIIACSGRALAESANRAGFKVCVVDCFADLDTKSFSEAVYQLQYNESGFIEEELFSHAQNIISQYPDIKFVTASGFESNPQLLDKLIKLAPVLSNSKETMLAINEPSLFFPMLKDNDISYPEITFNKPDDNKNYLVKKKSGFGGGHIVWANQDDVESDHYYQQYVSGKTYSALFLADGMQARLVGFNQQLQTSELESMPFLYKGAIRLKRDDIEQGDAVESIVNKISKDTNLKGLCGLDYVVNEQGKVIVLEVNPRPPATFELHEQTESLFEAHIACFDGKLPDINKQLEKESPYQGYAILYAKSDIIINHDYDWPNWVKDRPCSERVIHKKSPVCTVHASENSLDKVKTILFNRLQQIEAMIAATQNT